MMAIPVETLLSNSVIYVILSLLVVLLLIKNYRLPKKERSWLENLPGPTPPAVVGKILGNYTQFYHKKTTDHFKAIFKTDEDYRKDGMVRYWLGPTYVLVRIIKAEFAEVILNSKNHMDKAQEYNYLHGWLGTGLLTSTGSKWHNRRRLLTPSFHFRILNDFLPVFSEHGRILCEKLMLRADGQTSFDIQPFITLCTLDAICETAMGKRINAQESGGNSLYVQAVKRMSEIVITRFKSPWYWNEILFNLSPLGREQANCLKILHQTTDQVIRERVKILEETPNATDDADSVKKYSANDVYAGKKKRMAFLDTLLAANNNQRKLNFADIREEVDTFMFEGHDTTSVATNWVIYLLGHHPEIQEKLYEEMMEIFGESDRLATYDDVKKMSYMECVVKETLRLYPSVPNIGRTLTCDERFGDYMVPKGTTMVVAPYSLHRDPEAFPNPEKFDPDRFTLDNSFQRHPFAYIPFSAGLRNCIGQKFAMLEEKLLLSTIVRNFTIKSIVPIKDIVLLPELVMRPKDGIEVILTKRKSTK